MTVAQTCMLRVLFWKNGQCICWQMVKRLSKLLYKDLLFLTGFALVKSPTVKYDKRHICHLELFEEKGSTVFVCKHATAAVHEDVTMNSMKKGENHTVEKNVKYTYSKINQLKPGMLANVYGVVTFFKHPFLSKGTDYCSTLTITDQTGGKLSCNMFNEKQDALPQIYKTGDIVRFHRIKIQQFQGDLRGITNVGFSALTFDGRMGSPVSPRTSSKSYHFSDEDRRIVEQLRQWTMEQSPILEPALKLSEVQPQQFFDLICQLVAKAEMDRSSTLLKVWDGTKCLYPIHKVQVDGEVLEGNPALIFELQNISVDIMAYDNHTEVAKCLKPGAYVRIYNLHAKLQASTESDSQSSKCIEFYLHGGTSYGRGIKILPEDCYDVKELKKVLESAELSSNYLSDSTLLGISSPLNELADNKEKIYTRLERCQEESVTVLTSHQHMEKAPLINVKTCKPPQKFCIRAKVESYEPKRLYQCVKLYCHTCKTLQEVPDEDDIAHVLQEASKKPLNSKLHNMSWYNTVLFDKKNQDVNKIALHFLDFEDVVQDPEKTLILTERVTLNEINQLSRKFGYIILVTSTEEKLTLLDLSAPFLIQGQLRHYGCKHCSVVQDINCLQQLTTHQSWSASTISQILGIHLLHYVFMIKLTLKDGTASVDAMLWEEAEKFFKFSAAEVIASEVLQEQLELTMNMLCPKEKNPDKHPWFECCIKSYSSEDQIVSYQIFDTVLAEKI
ncbi:protection of telomeres protein 1 isoform X6 [Polypterus senegalus]|uniref:protection of telomeres protein 1 isoform X6 n=1 Tax=Polypterus senegalus TaxID=55291 RepID=UPI001964DF61|nr:protection of telomeres protein 1 isoform X6 [Polypterus senegalus]XP_039617099.1 protection of telomeres protein 1 isoform X6 [Polypterus senegalus]